jgi:hypothetical protein
MPVGRGSAGDGSSNRTSPRMRSLNFLIADSSEIAQHRLGGAAIIRLNFLITRFGKSFTADDAYTV